MFSIEQPERSPAAAQESFQVRSGMYDLADDWDPVAFVVFQYCARFVASSKSVPPTATLKGVEARPLTARPNCAAPRNAGSHPAEPESPAATMMVIPWAAPCSHRLLWNALPALPPEERLTRAKTHAQDGGEVVIHN